MVAEGDRLGRLQVREAGHRVGRVLRRAVGQNPHQVGHLSIQPIDGVPHPEAEIGRHLVVAAAGGMQALAGLAHQLGQARLDVQVHVLQVQLPLERPGRDLLRDGSRRTARPRSPPRLPPGRCGSPPRPRV